jgi:putative FmdB family regulatory protein
MPTYDYQCPYCTLHVEMVRPIAERDVLPRCIACDCDMPKMLSAPLFKFAGQVTPGGGPDRFTADMLGIPLKELPTELKADR